MKVTVLCGHGNEDNDLEEMIPDKNLYTNTVTQDQTKSYRCSHCSNKITLIINTFKNQTNE